MSWTGIAAAAAIMIPALPPAPPPAAAEARPQASADAEITVLTYNVKGLPWPFATGRATALREIGRELARMRLEGRSPDVVLIQEGFRWEIADLVRASGYRYWAQGPRLGAAKLSRVTGEGPRWRSVRYPLKGEGWGKFTGSGLHVLSDLPVSRVEGAVYRHCAGFDCLASKGVMLVRLSLPGGEEVEVVNTHLNSRGRSGVPAKRTLRAHNGQTDEFLQFLAERHAPDLPLLIGGDFNVRNAPERYDYEATARPYKVVAEFCGEPGAGCEGHAPPADARPWLALQDLQAFGSDRSVEIRPVRIDTLFGSAGRKALSDHLGYMVSYRIRRRGADPGEAPPTATATAQAGRALLTDLEPR